MKTPAADSPVSTQILTCQQRRENVMKRFWHMGLAFLVALSLLAGCSSIPVLKRSTGKTRLTKSSRGKTKEGLYSQVPAANRAPVREAEFDLKEAQAKMELSKEKVKLAELQKERALLERKYVDYGMEFSEINAREAELEVEIRKLEAIDNSNLGDKEHNIKEIANLKTKKLGMESDGIQVKAEFDTTELKIKKLTKEIEAQKTTVAKMENKKAQKSTTTKAKKSKKSSSRKRKRR
jgi:ribosomal protein S6E (S10)